MNENKDQSAGNLQRTIQQEQDQDDKLHDAAKAGKESKQPVQTGHRSQPVPPLPAQHLAKPGSEAQMSLKPRFLAPDYCGSGKLAGMVACVGARLECRGGGGIGRCAW